MKIFVAGATGAIGRVLVPRLVAQGHDVIGMTHNASKQDLVRSLGAHPVVADALDSDAVARAVTAAEPEVIVHQLTALSGSMGLRDARHPERSSAAIMTSRLRTEATDARAGSVMRQVVANDGAAGGHGTMAGARLFAPIHGESDLQKAFLKMVEKLRDVLGHEALPGTPLLKPQNPRNAKTLSGRPRTPPGR